MLQGPGMHAVSIRNNEIHECKPWKRYLARSLWEKILPKYLIWKLASRENKKKNSANKHKPCGRSEQVALHEARHGHSRCCAESAELSGVITHAPRWSLGCRQSQPSSPVVTAGAPGVPGAVSGCWGLQGLASAAGTGRAPGPEPAWRGDTGAHPKCLEGPADEPAEPSASSVLGSSKVCGPALRPCLRSPIRVFPSHAAPGGRAAAPSCWAGASLCCCSEL